MKEKKYILANFAFYDPDTIQRRLEDLAAAGWMPEKAGNTLWRFRRTEPQQLRFCVTYFPNASEYDPGPTDGQLTKEEFCAQDGWVLVLRWGSMQIFCNSLPDPIPIETDPVARVENLTRAMKKNLFLPQLYSIGLMVYVLALNFWQMSRDPLNYFSSSFQLLVLPVYLLSLLFGLEQIGYYFLWTRRARAAAREGTFLPISNQTILSRVVVILDLLFFALALFCSGFGRGVTLLGSGLMLACITFLANTLRLWLKKRGASRRRNFWTTLAFISILSVAFSTGLVALTLSGVLQSPNASKPVGTYVHEYYTFEIYDDPIPLEVEDLYSGQGGNYSRRATRQSSPFLSYDRYEQRPLYNQEEDYPQLRYTITSVRFSPVYGLCKDHLLYLDETDRAIGNEYRSVPADGYGCQELYQLYTDGEPRTTYCIFWPDRMAGITFYDPISEDQLRTAIRILQSAE